MRVRRVTGAAKTCKNYTKNDGNREHVLIMCYVHTQQVISEDYACLIQLPLNIKWVPFYSTASHSQGMKRAKRRNSSRITAGPQRPSFATKNRRIFETHLRYLTAHSNAVTRRHRITVPTC